MSGTLCLCVKPTTRRQRCCCDALTRVCQAGGASPVYRPSCCVPASHQPWHLAQPGRRRSPDVVSRADAAAAVVLALGTAIDWYATSSQHLLDGVATRECADRLCRRRCHRVGFLSAPMASGPVLVPWRLIVRPQPQRVQRPVRGTVREDVVRWVGVWGHILPF